MADKTWKQAERRLAKHFGTVRNALSGSNSKLSGSDSIHPTLYLESKQRGNHAVWTLYLDAKEKAKKEGKTPVLGLFKNRSPGVLLCFHSDDIDTFITEWLMAHNQAHLLVFLTTPPPPEAPPKKARKPKVRPV